MDVRNPDRALVVIPTYNERENLETAVLGVLSVADDLDLLVVDDASPDGTGDLADALVDAHPGRVSVLHREGKLGLGSAYLTAFKEALSRGYGMVCEMDADGSHDPADVPRLVSAVRDGADVAIGSRRVPGGRVVGWGPHRHLMSWAAMTFSRMMLGLKTRDVTAGFRCYRADAARMLIDASIGSDGYAFQEETLFLCERAGYRIQEIPTVFKDRELGASKLSSGDIREFFAVIRRLRRRQ